MDTQDEHSSSIGPYQLLRYLTYGTRAIVWLAQHQTFMQPLVALKQMHTKYVSAEQGRVMFEREALFLNWLRYPHIIPLYDYDIQYEIPYLVLEFADGGSLRQRIARYARFTPPNAVYAMPLPEAITIVAQVGQALSFIHQEQVFHCSVNPGNILLKRDGRAFLADFGSAVLAEEGGVPWNAGRTGTPTYVAPEQFRGEVCKKSDQYALGCVAYELVTGQPPFVSDLDDELSYLHQHIPPVPPSYFNPSIPRYVEYAILKALEKRRINRFGSVLQFVRALRGWTLI